jgi:hypothetical protein
MTDLATIRIPVDTSDMVKAVQDTRRFEREIKLLFNAFQSGTINSKQYNAGIVQLRKEFQQLFGVSYQMATNRVRGHAKALEQQSAITKRAIVEQRNLNSVMKESAAVTQAATQATSRSLKSQSQFGLVAQQTGYQVGDFLVQIQSGTNAFVAFGQQATQLAGLLYLIPGAAGAIAGTVASILIPSLTAVLGFFSRTGEQARTFSDILKDISQDVDTFNSMKESIEKSLVMPMDEASRALKEYLALRKQAAGEELVTNVRSALGDILEPSIEAQRLSEQRLRRGRLRGDERAIEESRLNLYKLINETLIEATIGPAEQLGIRLVEAVRSLQEMNLLTDEMSDGLDALLNETGLLVQAQESQVAAQQASLDLVNSQEEAAKALLDQRIEERKEQDRLNQLATEALGRYENMRTVSYQLAENTRLAADNWLRMRQFEGTAAGQALGRYGGRGGTSGRALEANFDLTPERESRGATGIRNTIQLTKELTEVERQRLDVIKSVESSLESGFMSMIDGTKSVKDAFRSMARDIIAELYRVFVVQRIVGAIGGAVSLASNPNGLGFFRASGGSVMPGQSYIVGEKGPEIITPRHSGTVVPAHLSAQGGQSSMTVNNNITVTGSDAANVRMEVAKMIPQITEATKAAVIDARRRGGQMRAAFV